MERERVWLAHILGAEVIVRHYTVVAPGEQLTENPPTQTMSLAEWRNRHGEFDCHLDGRPRNPRPGVGAPIPEASDGAMD